MPTSVDRSRSFGICCGLCLSVFLVSLVASPPPVHSQTDKATPKKSAAPPAKSTTKPAAPAAEKNTAEKNAADKNAKKATPKVDEDTAVADADAEESKERIAADRFLAVLEKNPRRGTALDKVYGFHVERGSLDKWLKQYQDRVAKQDQDGTAWMLIGLIEAHRGQDASAVKALQKAEQFLPENPMAAFYLGQSLVLIGQPELAAAAFERAIERKPPQADLLEIFQALGRVYQRSQQGDKALEVWNRLEKLFPNDLRVQEQIAQTLMEEGQAALALPRFEKLVTKTTKDLYRQSQFRIQVAEIKVRLGKAKDGLADFEQLLGQLNPDNWLYRDVRHKIDEVFLRTDDQAGLATYYEAWVGKHPEDVDAMARLARILASQGRAPESQQWLEKGLKLAPSRKELRMTIIDQLVYDQKYPEAIKHYELLDQREPNNPDVLRDWGRLILKDLSLKEADRKVAAANLWKRLVAAKPQDPVTATQVADLFRHAEMPEEALVLYKKSVELAPDSPQYREYLGEYYHQLKRKDEALAAWRQIVANKNRTAPNLARLAEVLMGFGYLEEGTAALADAVKLESDDFALRLRYAKALNRGEKYESSLQELAAANKLVTNAEESEAVLQLELQNHVSASTMPKQIEGLEKELAGAKAEPSLAKKWYLLARYYESDRKLTEALRSIKQAVELDPQSTVALATMARVQESNNSLLEAADTNRKLAAVDRRFRTEYLTAVAKLEARLGRRAEALQAGRDVISSAPGNPDSYEFFAQLCFQLGENDEGLETLRRSVRVNPSDPKVVLGLASALAEQFKTAEAIELYWRAFEKSAEIEGKLDVITKLTELYLRTNHLDKLLERMERERREDAQQQRVMTLCIAQAHQSAGDFGTARSELERMLAPDTRDTPLLQQLAKLAESEGDYTMAIKYQQQLNKLAPSKEHELQLAQYLASSGETEQASQLMVKLALDEKDPDKLLKSLDGLLQREQTEQALQITERLLRDQPRNWEFLYREGVALYPKEPARAEERFQQILALTLPDDELGSVEKARLKLAAGQRPNQGSAAAAVLNNPIYSRHAMRSQNAQMLRFITGLDSRNRYYYANNFFAPSDYGSARMAAYAWIMSAQQKQGKLEAYIKAKKEAWEQAKTTPRVAWDWYYIQALQQNPADLHVATRALAMLPGSPSETQFLYLMSLSNRGQPNAMQARRATNATPADNTPPLSEEELQLVLDVYKRTMGDPNFEQLSLSFYGASLVNIVTTELTRSKRDAEAKQLYADSVAKAKSAEQISVFMNKAAADGDMEQFMKLWDAIDKLPVTPTSTTHQYMTSIAQQGIPRLMAHRAEAKAFGDVLVLLDRYLVHEQKRKAAETAVVKTRNQTYGNPYSGNSQTYFQLWLTKNNSSHVQLDFPVPNAHYDYVSIMLLRNAYGLYEQADLTSDLLKHFHTAASKPDTSAAERLPWLLGEAYLHWWNESQDEALKELRTISQSLPDDQNFKLDLAGLFGTRNEFADSLELLDSIAPLDQDVLQRRETLALRAAFQLGEADRAREAAARLFGLRLDAETQIQLASQMKQLGMHEQADAVMARAGRQAGNRMGAMLSLMREYQSQGNTDTALQIAQTILRRTQSRSAPSTRFQNQDQNASYRQQAVQFLVDSGKLKELIERAETQLKNAPKSIQLHQTLVEYYTASGDKEKSKQISLKLLELNQNDPMTRWNIARQLLSAGETDAAVEHLKSALKQRPQLFANEYWEVQNAFRRAKKTMDLVKILEEIDLKQIGQYYVVSNIISELIREEPSRKAALQLLKRAWEAYPQERVYLLSSIYDDEVWKTPELYDYARQAFIPQEGVGFSDPWAGFDIRSYSSNGTVSGSLHHLLVAAKAQKKAADLEQEIKRMIEKSPDWHGGRAMLAIIQTQRGEHAPALATFQDILANKDKGLTGQAAWLIGQELQTIPDSADLAVQFFEFADADPNISVNNQFQYSPGSALVTAYEKTGKKEQARKMLLKAAVRSPDSRYDQQYQAYQRIQSQYEIAERLRKLAFPIDSIKIYNRILLDRHGLELSQNYGGREFSTQARKGLETALLAIDASQLSTGVQSLLQPLESPEKDAAAPAIDLFLSLQPPDGKTSRVTSLLVSIIDKVAKQPALQTELESSLQKMSAERPEDVSIRVLATLLALRNPDAGAFAKAVEQLDQWLTAHPLEELTEGKRSNARQRELATQQVPVWLIARECLTKEPLREVGQRLSQRAVEAARRQMDNGYLLAIVREGGQLAWEAGDAATAEARWSEMVELIMTPLAAGPAKRTGPVANAVPASVPQPAVAVARPSPSAPPRIRKGPLTQSVTLAQFKQVLDIAWLAEEKKLHALSFKAVKTAFRGGPPLEVDPNAMVLGGPVIRSSSPVEGNNNVDVTVANALYDLQKLWVKNQAPADQAYDVLVAVVFPESRPDEVFLYPRPMPGGDTLEPRSVGLLLVKQAVLASKVDALREQLEKLPKAPKSELESQLMLTMLALETKDLPRAKVAFEALGKLVDRHQNQNASELLCQVALSAIDNEELSLLAQPVLIRAARHLTAGPNNRANAERVSSLKLRLARLEFKSGKVDSAKVLLNEYVKSQDAVYQDYGGDYGQYMHKQALQRVAGEFAKAGHLQDAMLKLGEAADMPKFQNYGDSDDGTSMPAILKQLKARPPEEQYEILKTWTLPTEGRKTIRMLARFGPPDSAPEAFVKGLLTLAQNGRNNRQGLESSARLLVTAAEKIKKLDELEAAVIPLAEQKLDRANELLALIRLAQKKAKEVEPDIKMMMKDLREKPGRNRQEAHWAYAVASESLADPELKAAGQELAQFLIGYAQVNQHGTMVPHLRYELSQSLVAGFKGAKDVGGPDPGLKWWRPGVDEASWLHAAGSPPGWWVANAGIVSHICGTDVEYLYFLPPMLGTFEFSVDSYYGGWAEGNVGYAGLAFVGLMGGSETEITPHGRSEVIYTPPGPRAEAQFMRHTIQVRPNHLRYLINNTLLYEDNDTGSHSPWLALRVGNLQHAAFRNARITGHPIIPREVRLSDTDRLEGWLSNFYSESQPPRRQIGKAERYDPNRVITRDPSVNAYDWAAQDGIIHGRKLDSAKEGQQSRLYYHRPLENGDTLAYEFLYQPGTTHVHPALDRLTFLLEPAGVRLHWITDGAANPTSDLTDTNVIDVPEERRGPPALPLLPGEWNTMRIMLQLPMVRLELNGQLIYETQLDPANRRMFGLFHDKSKTEVKVRNVTLSGNWPDELSAEMLTNLFATNDASLTVADRQARSAIIGEQFYLAEVADVVQQSRKLPDEQRYAVLRNWVLPSDDHATFRLVGFFTPVDQHPATGANAPAPSSIPQPALRMHTGGELQSPIYELIAAARKLDKLPELKRTAETLPARSPLDKRAKLACLCLINLASEKWSLAESQLVSLQTAQSALPPTASVIERWPDLLVAIEAAQFPETRLEAQRILEESVVQSIRQSPSDEYSQMVRHLRDHGRWLAERRAWKASKLPEVSAKQWIPTSTSTAAQRTTGIPPGHWRFTPGELRHYAGQGESIIYFQSPLRGDFEFECEMTSFNWRETSVLYAGEYTGITYGLNEVQLGRVGGQLNNGVLEQGIRPLGDMHHFKLTVKEGLATVTINGEKIRERRIAPDGDPWLAFHTAGRNTGTVRDVRITGTPTIPDELDLMAVQNLYESWRGNHFTPTDVWAKDEREMSSAKKPALAGRHHQNLLQYHRPLVEDSQIEYEFFYEPDAVGVHPALDRLALLVEPDGVNVHWLTDSAGDQVDLPPDNVSTEKDNRRGPEKLPLKVRDWNQATLKLVGQQVTLAINGVDVYQRELEPTNQRTFGLFHFADQTQARVRNIRYRGDWPKTLPSVEQQELAGSLPSRATFAAGELPHELTWNAKRPATAKPVFHIVGGPEFVKMTPGGLQTNLPAGREKPQMVGVSLTATFSGDFEVITKFSGLKVTRPEKDSAQQGPGIDVGLFQGGTHQQWMKLEQQLSAQMRRVLLPVHGESGAGDRWQWYVPQHSDVADAQRFKIVRKGAFAYFLVAAHDSDKYKLVEQRVVGTQPVDKIELLTRAFGKDQGSEVLLEELTIRSQNPIGTN